MGSKLYVGNLSFQTTEEDLGAHFGDAGTVTSTKIITDRDTGRSRGFGFVEMSSPEEAQQAVEKFNGQEFAGRNLKVDIAKEKS
ncbi:MAG: RNA-binding protein [Bacteriovoracaceae bacterium]|nr:RNA-binding protein [Bacteriovoracaceae bacterium]